MTFYLKSDRRKFPWFFLGMAAIFMLSIALRFWGLGRFNTLVFDEVYFAKFASNYLKGVPLFEGHPPLSTYILALGVWIAQHTPLGDDGIKNNWTGLYLSPFSYRWMNALTGSFIPLVMGAIAYQLSQRRTYALIATLFTAVDGLLLVESRYALINVYLILFGLLGHWFLLIALNQPRQRLAWLGLAGIFLGAATAVKWNGLGFLLGIYLTWSIAWLIRGGQWLRKQMWSSSGQSSSISTSVPAPLQNFTQLHPGHVLFFLGLLPFFTYWLSWLPYLQLTPDTTFWQWQAKIIDYHHRVGGMNVHHYCSTWYSWFVMWRPIAYFYKTAHAMGEPPPIVGPPLPQAAERVIYDVHAMGNPLLWWLASAAILVLLAMLIGKFWRWIAASRSQQNGIAPSTIASSATYTGIILYLTLNWVANWFPWITVTRCTFLYHYMESLVFSFLAIALLVDRGIYSPKRWHRTASMTAIFLILLAFIFWLPFYLGLPLSPAEVTIRRWFNSWI